MITEGQQQAIADDPVATSLTAFLQRERADGLRHGAGRTLLDHLVETCAVLRRWKQPSWLQHAGLIHSVYGTDTFEEALLPKSRRAELAAIAGEQAERLAYLFCVTPREQLFAGLHRWTQLDNDATRYEHDALVLLHMANLAEQAQARDGSPGRWLVRLRELAELVADSEVVTPPVFTAQLATFTDGDEALTRRAYLDGEFAVAAAVCPVVAEPCVRLAQIARSSGDESAARRWAESARKRLHNLGSAWDKRLRFDEWVKLTEGQPATLDSGRATAPNLACADTTKRFWRYVETLAEDGLGRVYPDLESRPWWDPQDFPLARYLEEHAEEVRDEVLSLDPSAFHREAERIARSGDWDVAFFYERGRRRDEICDQCPHTTWGIESYPAVRTLAGLIYGSRMRPGTHIQPHRGPTNLRIRCHLGIEVPDGDCAIRVGEETRHWQEGRCLVFDDYFEHEAWNHTDEDRIVLIVDLWHPGLSDAEIRLLEGLHRYAYGHAGRLNRYWSANAAARGER